MADIFISYAREDRDHARRLAKALELNGWSVWWDPLIPTGSSFNRVIEEALNSARCVIVLWSRHSVESNYVQNEASEADARGVLVPVLLEQVRIPLAFRHLHMTPIDELDHVVGSIRALLGQERPPAPSPAPARSRRMTWISAIVVVAIIAAVALIAKKSGESTTTTSIEQATVSDTVAVTDTIKPAPSQVSPVNANPTNANPTNANPSNAMPAATTTTTDGPKARPRPEVHPDKVINVTVRRDVPGVESYVAEGTDVPFGGRVEIRNQLLVLTIHCVDLDCAQVMLRMSEAKGPTWYRRADSSSRTLSRFVFDRDEIASGGHNLVVLVDGQIDVFRIHLVKRS